MKTPSMPAALFLSICVAATACAQNASNLPGADFAPGKLKLPLTVHERSGVARTGAAVTSGVPFPIGFLSDVGKLAVVDSEGKPVPSQASAMVRWHKPAYDDSVQWALVSFLCDVAANGTATYYLVDSGGQPTATPLKTVKTDKEIRVDTGPASFVIPLAGDALIARATVGGREVIGGAGLRGTIASGDWPDRGLKVGDVELSRHDTAEVEEAGPVRTVVAIKGQYAPGDREKRGYGFTARLYFAAGSAAVRVVYTINNSYVDPKIQADGWRHVFSWPIEDASLVADLVPGDFRATTLAEGKPVSSDKGLRVYQDSSGGDKWQNLGGGNYAGWISGYTGGKTVRGVTFRGYKVTEGGRELASGNASPGVIDASSGGAGVTAALRNFRVEHPSALEASLGRFRVGLFPGEFSEPFCLKPGQRKTWDVLLTLHAADSPDMQACCDVEDTLLLFRAEPAWVVRAAIDGAWPYGLALAGEPKQASPQRMDKSKLDGIQTGWDWYGWISGYNSGGGHWNEETVLAPWVLWGDGANLDYAESRGQWADLTSIHFDNPDFAALWLWLMDWNDHEPRIKRETYPGWYNRDTWGHPDSGHMGMLMWPELYFVTGDTRYREDIEHLGNRARAMLWQHNHDDRADGTGPMKGAVNWCRKRDPDKEPDFRLATRYVGWPLFDLANWYRICGDPQILAECQTVARAFRNTARFSPIGFMVLQVNSAGDRAVYGGQGPFERYRDQSASQCYAHFQEGLMCTGLIEYYLMSRDREALDAMIGFADLMVHHCLLKDPQGVPRGWTYAFGDYWGPYTWDDTGGGQGVTFMVSNYTVTEALGWIYRFTGRADYLAIDKLAVAQAGPTSFNVAAALAAVAHPKTDPSPPAAIKDLHAEVLGNGKVKLTWTAPGGDGDKGAAAGYQAKCHTGKLVELTAGWPNRTPPQPRDAKQWADRADAFNAAQRAFWSATTIPGAPVPAAAGSPQEMVITDLTAGKLSIAIKSWDAAGNLSPLSNVVEVDVK